MYSHEDKLKAVQLYIESSRKERTVINVLGYPSPNALRQWYEEYIQTGELHKKSKGKPRFTKEQIRCAVEYYDEHGGSLAATARALGYPNRNTLREWIKAAHPDEDIITAKHCKVIQKQIRCSPEQKKVAVIAWIKGTPDYKVAAQYGVSKAALYVWKKQLLGEGPSINMKKEKSSLPDQLPDSKEALEAEIKLLKEQIHQLQFEKDVLETAAEVLKKGKGINLEKMTNAEKADLIDALKGKYRLNKLLNHIRIAKGSYFYQQNAALRPDKYADLRAKIKNAFYENAQCYGYRRIYAILRKDSNAFSEKVIRRIMSEEQLVVYCARRKKYSSYMGETSPAVENVIARDFHADAPNVKWLTDITEFALPAGKVYLSPVIDCFDGMAVSWTIGTSPSAELANTMLDDAITHLGKDEHPVIHSDRGCHYRCPG